MLESRDQTNEIALGLSALLSAANNMEVGQNNMYLGIPMHVNSHGPFFAIIFLFPALLCSMRDFSSGMQATGPTFHRVHERTPYGSAGGQRYLPKTTIIAQGHFLGSTPKMESRVDGLAIMYVY